MRRLRTAALAAGGTVAAALAFSTAPALAAYTAQIDGDTLDVVGNSAPDALALRLAPGDPGTLQLDVNDDGTADFAFARSQFRTVDVQAGGGDDTIRVDRSNGVFTDTGLTLEGGNGNDTLLGGDGADVLSGGNGNDTVDGDRGNDVALLGPGNDTFTWDPGEGNDTIEGNEGNDTLAFHGSNAAEKIAVTANGYRTRLTRDVAAIDMDFDGVENVDVTTLGSADAITAGDLTGTAVKTVDVDPGSADGAADTVIAQGTDGDDATAVKAAGGELVTSGLPTQTRMAAGDALDTLQVAGQGGDDTLTFASTVTGPAAGGFDGGEGTDTALYKGTSGDDQVGIANNGTVERAFSPGAAPLDVKAAEGLDIQGLAGNDTVVGQNGLAAFAPLTIEGGSGDDTLFGGDGADVILGGSGDDFADGNRGADTASLGGGDDRFQWDPGDGNDVVDGDGGDNTLQFNGSNIGEQIDLAADGSGARLFRNVGAVTTELTDIHTVAVSALGGSDQLTVNDLTGTGVKTVALGLGHDATPDTAIVNGTAAADKVRVTRDGDEAVVSGLAAQTRVSGSDPGLDTLAVNTLDGRDAVTVQPDVGALINPVVNLGAGQ
jgi:Ca2+-binding RTX toxin-like protein